MSIRIQCGYTEHKPCVGKKKNESLVSETVYVEQENESCVWEALMYLILS